MLERVANREAEWLSHAYTEAHASVLIEAAARGWHGRRKAARQRAHAAAALRIQFAGRLRGKVRIDDCYWVIDDDYEGGRALQVVLAKASTFTKWEGLFVE